MDDEWIEYGTKLAAEPGRRKPYRRKKGSAVETRRLLRAYVHLAASTGIRPGTEMEFIRWGQFRTGKKDGRSYRYVTLRAGEGKIKASRDAFVWEDTAAQWHVALDDLKAINPGAQGDDFMFVRSTGRRTKLNEAFKVLLSDVGLLTDPTTGLPRTLYSLRHTYATLRLLSGVRERVLAKWMGTSVEMIIKYYDKVAAHEDAQLARGTKTDIQLLRDRFSANKKRAIPEPIEDADQDWGDDPDDN
jgi:integrase